MTGFDIGKRHIGDGSPCLIVTEVGLAHDGVESVAHAYVDAVAGAGADAVKFQCHLGDSNDQWRVRPSWSTESRLDYWRRTGFSQEQWHGLEVHALDSGLEFLCSPFSVEAVEMLDPLVEAWKVPSGKLADRKLLWTLQRTGKPVIMSTGMAAALEPVMTAGMGHPFEFHPHAFLQCTSEYPTPPEHVGLNLVQEWRRWNVPIGLSDHSGTIYPVLAAVALGCDILEVHVKLSEHDTGLDASSSITIEKLAELVEGVRFIEKAKQPVDKDQMAEELAPMREQFMGVKV